MRNTTVRFLNLSQMHFPVTAISSILHRISGVFLFLAVLKTMQGNFGIFREGEAMQSGLNDLGQLENRLD